MAKTKNIPPLKRKPPKKSTALKRFGTPADAIDMLLSLILDAARRNGLPDSEATAIYDRVGLLIPDNGLTERGLDTASDLIVFIAGPWLKLVQQSEPALGEWIKNQKPITK